MRRAQHGGIFFKLLVLVTLFVFAAFLYLMRGPLLHLAGQLWVTTDPPEHSDAIVVLGDDNYHGDRAAHAAELYQAGWAPLVVASGRLLRPNAGLAELMAHDLESHGVPAAAIVQFSHRASNTEEEAEALNGLVNSRRWKRVLIVTSDYHARRTRFIFGRIFPPDVTVRVSASHDYEFDPAHWWETRAGEKLFLHEVFGYLVAWWDLRHESGGPAGTIFFVSTLVSPGRFDRAAVRRPFRSFPVISSKPDTVAGENGGRPYLIGNNRALCLLRH